MVFDAIGAWVIHLVMIFFGKILVDIIPGITQDVSWTTVNIAYDIVSSPPWCWSGFRTGGVKVVVTLWRMTSTPDLLLISSEKPNIWCFVLSLCPFDNVFVSFHRLLTSCFTTSPARLSSHRVESMIDWQCGNKLILVLTTLRPRNGLPSYLRLCESYKCLFRLGESSFNMLTPFSTGRHLGFCSALIIPD